MEGIEAISAGHCTSQNIPEENKPFSMALNAVEVMAGEIYFKKVMMKKFQLNRWAFRNPGNLDFTMSNDITYKKSFENYCFPNFGAGTAPRLKDQKINA